VFGFLSCRVRPRLAAGLAHADSLGAVGSPAVASDCQSEQADQTETPAGLPARANRSSPQLADANRRSAQCRQRWLRDASLLLMPQVRKLCRRCYAGQIRGHVGGCDLAYAAAKNDIYRLLNDPNPIPDRGSYAISRMGSPSITRSCATRPPARTRRCGPTPPFLVQERQTGRAAGPLWDLAAADSSDKVILQAAESLACSRTVGSIQALDTIILAYADDRWIASAPWAPWDGKKPRAPWSPCRRPVPEVRLVAAEQLGKRANRSASRPFADLKRDPGADADAQSRERIQS
jgi:hypothetical protein